MSDLEDLEPRKKPVQSKDLSPWSIEELRDYIARLEAEIARARQAIAAKAAQRKGAESLFKK